VETQIPNDSDGKKYNNFKCFILKKIIRKNNSIVNAENRFIETTSLPSTAISAGIRQEIKHCQ